MKLFFVFAILVVISVVVFAEDDENLNNKTSKSVIENNYTADKTANTGPRVPRAMTTWVFPGVPGMVPGIIPHNHRKVPRWRSRPRYNNNLDNAEIDTENPPITKHPSEMDMQEPETLTGRIRHISKQYDTQETDSNEEIKDAKSNENVNNDREDSDSPDVQDINPPIEERPHDDPEAFEQSLHRHHHHGITRLPGRPWAHTNHGITRLPSRPWLKPSNGITRLPGRPWLNPNHGITTLPGRPWLQQGSVTHPQSEENSFVITRLPGQSWANPSYGITRLPGEPWVHPGHGITKLPGRPSPKPSSPITRLPPSNDWKYPSHGITRLPGHYLNKPDNGITRLPTPWMVPNFGIPGVSAGPPWSNFGYEGLADEIISTYLRSIYSLACGF